MTTKSKNSLIDNYLATAPIGQAKNVTQSKIDWMNLNFAQHFPAKQSACLEIGPGQGELLILFKDLGFKKVKSIDISKDVCEHIKKLGFDCELVKDSSQYLKQRYNQFDLIVLNDVLEHVPKDQVVDLVSSIRASLKPKGKLLIKVPNAQSPHFAIGRYGDLTHEQSFTETSFIQLFRACGFEKYNFIAEKIPFKVGVRSFLAICIIRPIYFWWIRNIRAATGHSSPKILTQAIIAVAEK